MTAQTFPGVMSAQLPLAELRDHSACETYPIPVDRRRDGDFWSKVLITECCWLWARATNPDTGYGVFWQAGRLLKAHRFAYLNAVGPIPFGLDLMHTCDVRRCVRPDHLRPGTRRENQRDMAAKGRGGGDGRRKLTDEQVRAIRSLRLEGRTLASIAAEYAVTTSAISNICAGKTRRRALSKAVAA